MSTPAAAAPPVSLVMTTYNHGRFVGEALRAALDQRYPALEVVVCDDASRDDTWAVVQEVVDRYEGPHTVVTHRQAANVGPGANTLHAVSMARGRLHVRAHGDDLSMPDRVARVVALWRRTGASLIAHNALQSTGLGQPATLLRPAGPAEPLTLEHICGRGWTSQMLGATFSWDPRLFEVFGSFDRRRLVRGGDHVLPLRGALLGGTWYLGEPLLLWRQHADQMTRKTADFTGSTHVVGETLTAYDLAPQLQRLVDLRAVRRRADDSALVRAENLVLQVIVNTAASWRSHRVALRSDRQVLGWAARGDGPGPGPIDARAQAERTTAGRVEQAVERVLAVHGASGRARWAERLRAAVAELVAAAEAWTLARNQLLNDGLRPQWRPA